MDKKHKGKNSRKVNKIDQHLKTITLTYTINTLDKKVL